MSASQAAGWAERSSREWESIFNDARGHRTKFSEAPEALPFHARVPIFDRSLDGKVVDGTLRSSAVFEWDVRPSIAGLVPAYATTSSECIFAIQSPTLVDFDNNYPRYPEGTTHLRMNHRDMYDSVADLPHTPSICADDLTEPNYLGLLTLAWGYVLSAYWTATQKGKIYYTEHKAPCNSSSPDCVSQGYIFRLDVSVVPNEVRWWQAVLAPRRGWEAIIHRQGQTWLSPWTVENRPEGEFVIVWNGDGQPDIDQPPGYQQAHDMLAEFTTRRGLQCQSSMALMAALNIPTHNVWALPVHLPLPHAMDQHCSASTGDTTTFKRLKDLIPRLITVALFGVESFLRSGFYEETSVHSLSSGQWLQPAIVGWPDSTAFAAEVGCRRTPHLGKWWIGMAVSGMLSRKSVKILTGDAMWPTNLGVYAWIGAKDSYFCNVFGQDVRIRVSGTGKWATIPRAKEALVLFATSGNGPQGSLKNPPSSPWRPSGDVWLDRSAAKVVELARSNATIRLDYNNWHWTDGSRDVIPHVSIPLSASFDQMAECSGAVTRSLLGWLESMRGADADFNPELEALKDQIQQVEGDNEWRGSDDLSDVTPISHPPSDHRVASSTRPVGPQFDETEPVDWNGDIEKSCADAFFGWCGLDAINSGLLQLRLPTISKEEAVRILSVTTSQVEEDGMSVSQLEVLLNTRARSVAIVDLQSKQAYRLCTAKHKNSIVVVGLDSIPHFIRLSQ